MVDALRTAVMVQAMVCSTFTGGQGDYVCLCMQVTGCLKMRTFLSGMPECKLGLNDKVRAA